MYVCMYVCMYVHAMLKLLSSSLRLTFGCISSFAMEGKMDKLRKKYPEHVPVICVHSRDATKQQKLIVPFQTTSAAFQTIAREKCPWAMQGGEVLLCNKGKVTDTMEVPAQKTLQQLDSEYRAPDGGMYFTVEAAKGDVQEAPTGPQEFKMDESVPQQESGTQEKKKKAKAKAKAAMSEDRKEDDILERTRRIRKKHPDRVPVLINQAAVPGLPALDKKLLIPDSMTCRDLRKILPKHIGLADLDLDWSKVIFQMAGQAIGEDIEEHELVSAVYTRCVAPDDEGIMLSLELRGQLDVGAGEMQELQPPQDALSFSPPSAEELRVLELQLQEVNVAFEEAKKSQQLATAKLAEQEERAWAAEERALKADQELAMQVFINCWLELSITPQKNCVTFHSPHKGCKSTARSLRCDAKCNDRKPRFSRVRSRRPNGIQHPMSPKNLNPILYITLCIYIYTQYMYK